MSKHFLYFFLLILLHQNGVAQQDLEYVGAIKLNDTSLISYKIMFSETEGFLKGYSVTDLGGEHETKSYVSGYFDDDKNTLNFFESGIVYTKSPVTQNDFCYVHFDGALKNFKERQTIEGSFKGLYDNGDECIHGEISMINFSRILRKAKKLDKKIDRSIFVKKEKKERIDLTKSLDSLSMNVVRKNQVMSVFARGEEVTLSIYDAGKEDGDQIAIWVNGKVLLSKYTVTNTEKVVTLALTDKKTTLKVKALTNGTIGGNTVKIDIIDAKNQLETITSLKAGESTSFVFIKED